MRTIMKSNASQPATVASLQAGGRLNTNSGSSLPVWVRVGVPAALATLAGLLNANTVRQQLNPIEAFALKVDVSPGVRLKPEQFELVTVGGSLDREALLCRAELFAGLEGISPASQTIEAALKKTPMFFSRFLHQGELLTDGCLGGHEALSGDERMIQVPISKIRGDSSRLSPGQFVYFDAIHRQSGNEKPKVEEIGPFRVAVCERNDETKNQKQFLQLVFRLGPEGQISAQAETLRTAAYTESLITLALVEKSSMPNQPDKNLSSFASRSTR